jgi:hypothetical protein
MAPLTAPKPVIFCQKPVRTGQNDAWRRGGLDRMIRIAISQAAFEAIARTLPGSVSFENKIDGRGPRAIQT